MSRRDILKQGDINFGVPRSSWSDELNAGGFVFILPNQSTRLYQLSAQFISQRRLIWLIAVILWSDLCFHSARHGSLPQPAHPLSRKGPSLSSCPSNSSSLRAWSLAAWCKSRRYLDAPRHARWAHSLLVPMILISIFWISASRTLIKDITRIRRYSCMNHSGLVWSRSDPAPLRHAKRNFLSVAEIRVNAFGSHERVSDADFPRLIVVCHSRLA